MKIATAYLFCCPEDKPFVEAVAEALGRRGIIPLYKAIYPSIKRAKQAIEQDIAAVFFLSKSALLNRQLESNIREVLSLEAEENKADWIIPVFLEDPLEVVKSNASLDGQWLHANGDYVERDCIEVPEKNPVESIADKVSRRIYNDLLKLKSENNIALVIDQRGDNFRKSYDGLSQKVTELQKPTLVFRPDSCERSRKETLFGEEWESFLKPMKKSLTEALGNLRARSHLNVSILGYGQLGIAFFLGQYFDRTTRVILSCYDGNEFFTNLEQETDNQHSGGNPDCETVREKTNGYNSLLPQKIPPEQKYPTIALFVGKQKYLQQVHDHLNDAFPLVFIETLQPKEKFKESSEIMELALNIEALLVRFRDENETTTVHFYCDLPFNALPLSSVRLTYHVIPCIKFMEFRSDLIGLQFGSQETTHDEINEQLKKLQREIKETQPGSQEERALIEHRQNLEKKLQEQLEYPENQAYVHLPMS